MDMEYIKVFFDCTRPFVDVCNGPLSQIHHTLLLCAYNWMALYIFYLAE